MQRARSPEAKPTPQPDVTALPLGPRVASILEVAYRARRPVLLEGATGIGKSELVAEVARSLGIAHVVLDLSLLEPPDLVGLPITEEGRTRYALPHFLPRDGSGILMLEELNRAERYIQQPALQLLTARALHEYVLPEGWACFAAINPDAPDPMIRTSAIFDMFPAIRFSLPSPGKTRPRCANSLMFALTISLPEFGSECNINLGWLAITPFCQGLIALRSQRPTTD